MGLKKLGGFRKKYLVTLGLFVFTVLLVVYGEFTRRSRNTLVYAMSLDETVATVNGRDLTLRELAFYVAYEEALVYRQALVYDPEDTSKYWNAQVRGSYIRTSAGNAVIQMSIHDIIFAEMAEKEGIYLSSEEEEALADEQDDFWQDLVEDGKASRLGVRREDICDSMRCAALAEKYQMIYEGLQGAQAGDYDFTEEAYQKLLSEQDYQIDEKMWRRVDFGNVTLSQEE